uniref:Ankyrin repeat and BTB domain containing 1 n=1 Tax=Macaca fascicularis TaxID=9541 RepID=A0A2K5V6H4_MACFA
MAHTVCLSDPTSTPLPALCLECLSCCDLPVTCPYLGVASPDQKGCFPSAPFHGPSFSDHEPVLTQALTSFLPRYLLEQRDVEVLCLLVWARGAGTLPSGQWLLEQGIHSDVVFVVHGKPFRVHRCVLGARSAYFANMLDTKWKGKSVVVLRHPLINPVAFGALLQYLYTGRLDIGVEHVSDCERLAKQCQLWDLLSDLEAKCEKVSEFVVSKPGTCVKVLTIEPPPADPRLREDMALLADCALPPELRGDLWELPFPCPDGFNSCPDVCFRVAGCSFLCHKAFFCGRSDYFRALLDDHFRESEEPETSGGPPAITLHGISPDIFTHVLYYVYSDHTELSPEAAYDVLSIADMYLLPGLKRLCGRSLAQVLDEDSVVGVWRVAKLFRLARLEDQCTEYMAKVIEKLVEREDFVEAVKEEAAAVAARQETDSIPLVDDIRFHVASTVQTYSAIEEAQQRLRALEDLLVSIGLDC